MDSSQLANMVSTRLSIDYRLMEALAGGAMVLTDPMQPLPVHIQDGKHLLVYRSLGQLKRLIKYYLEYPEERLKIARAGHDLAMTAHRSWHIMERFVLGEWLRKLGFSFLLRPLQVRDELEFTLAEHE